MIQYKKETVGGCVMNYDYQFQNDGNQGGMPPVDLGGGYPPKTGQGMAIASFVLSLVSIFLLFFGCLCINLIPAILAVIFAFIAKKRDGKMPVLAILGLVFALICIVLTLVLLGFAVYIGVEIARNPDGEIANALYNVLDPVYEQMYGVTFREYVQQTIESAEAAQ